MRDFKKEQKLPTNPLWLSALMNNLQLVVIFFIVANPICQFKLLVNAFIKYLLRSGTWTKAKYVYNVILYLSLPSETSPLRKLLNHPTLNIMLWRNNDLQPTITLSAFLMFLKAKEISRPWFTNYFDWFPKLSWSD